MGKTIMLSALIHTNREPEPVDAAPVVGTKTRQLKLNSAFRPAVRRGNSAKGPSATLIVAPTSLLNQWSEELERSSQPGTLKALVWHGQNRLDIEAAIEGDDDDDQTIRAIVTSYGTLASEHAKGDKSPIFQGQQHSIRYPTPSLKLHQLSG